MPSWIVSEEPPAQCMHWRDGVNVGEGVVLCSGLLARPADATPATSPAYYLDHHLRAVAAAPDGCNHIEWPDMGVIDAADARALGETITSILAGGGTVEIGCLGGHGRTGTLLAIVVGITEALPPQQAVAEVRRRYCPHAIETPAQAQLVVDVLGDRGSS